MADRAGQRGGRLLIWARSAAALPWLLGCCATLVYFAVGALKYFYFSSHADLAIFFQALSSGADRPWFEVPIKGVGRNVFGDHFHPVILLVWPLVQLVPSPLTLIAVQALSVSTAMSVLVERYRSARPTSWRTFAAACYLGPAVQGVIAYDFHEVALGAPLVVWWVVKVVRGQHRAALLPALLLLLVKEDTAVLVVGLALVHLVRGARVVAGIVAVSAVSWYLVVTGVIIPAVARGDYTYASTIPRAPAAILAHLVNALVWPGLEAVSILVLLGSYASLVGRSALLLAPLPYLMALAAMGNFRYQTFFYHYYLLPVLLLAGAVVDAAARGRPEPSGNWRVVSWTTVAAMVVAGPVCLHLVAVPWSDQSAARAAMQEIPSQASVATDPALTARLATRARVFLLTPHGLIDGNGNPLLEVRWVLLDDETTSFGGNHWIGPTLDTLESQGFWVVSQHGRYRVLRR